MSNEANFGSYFQLPNPGLESYFDKVRKGNPDEYRTTFYRGKSLRSVLQGWAPKLKTLSQKWPTLVDFENDLAKKVGPMSIQKPLEERMDDIDSYYDSIHLESKPISKAALDKVVQEWGSHRGLQPRSVKETVDNMKLSTNSGSPYFTKRRQVIDSTVPALLWISGQDIKGIYNDGHYWLHAAVLGWRGQEGGPTDEDVKQRVVWMFPFALNVCELQVYQMGIDTAKRIGFCPAWEGMDAVDQRITKLFDTKGPSDLIICTDFSKFDQHFNEDMQNGAKYILSKLLNNSSTSRAWLSDIFPAKYMIPLAYDMDTIRYGPHGMGSGSGGTNFDETLSHRALQWEAAMHQKQRLNPNSQCLGDDGILTYPGITVEDVTQTYCSHGQDMNIDKQYASAHDCTYLRRWHHVDYRNDGVCVGVYSTYRALGRLCEQERYYNPEIWGARMVALRQLSIIENCKYHPLFYDFIDYCIKGDKYRLGLDIPGFLDNIQNYAQESIDLMPDFLGYTRSLGDDRPDRGITDWSVVKYLRSLK